MRSMAFVICTVPAGSSILPITEPVCGSVIFSPILTSS